MGARNERKSEGIGFLGFLYCSCACEEKAAGSVLAGPRRRRGGGRMGGSGGVAKGEGTSARKGGWWDAQARRVEATRQEVARAGPPRQAGGAVKHRKQAGRRKGKTGCFAISKNSRDLNVNQR